MLGADVSDADVELEIEEAKKNNPILIYTYGLNPSVLRQLRFSIRPVLSTRKLN